MTVIPRPAGHADCRTATATRPAASGGMDSDVGSTHEQLAIRCAPVHAGPEANKVARRPRAAWSSGSHGGKDQLEQSSVLLLRPMPAFADPAHEQDFVRYYNAFYYRYAQISLAVGLLLIFADFMADFFFAPG